MTARAHKSESSQRALRPCLPSSAPRVELVRHIRKAARITIVLFVGRCVSQTEIMRRGLVECTIKSIESEASDRAFIMCSRRIVGVYYIGESKPVSQRPSFGG